MLKNPGRALETDGNVATAAAGRNFEAALSTLPEVINFNHKGRGVHLGKFICFVLYKWNRKVSDYTHQHH